MSLYTLDDVIAECVTNYRVKGMAPGAKNEIYNSVWAAMNAWIETKLAKQKVRGLLASGKVYLYTVYCSGRESCRTSLYSTSHFTDHAVHSSIGSGCVWTGMFRLGS